MKRRLVCVGMLCVLGMAAACQAAPVTFSFCGCPIPRSASATFQVVSGNNLQVTLTNTSLENAMRPTGILEGLFWDITGSPALTASSAVLPLGTTILFPPADPIGEQWAYKQGLGAAGQPGGGQYGLGGAGFGVFGPGNCFIPQPPGPGAPPDGLNYGITTAGATEAFWPLPMLGPFIKKSIVFTLGGLPGGFDPSTSISNVWFQYGTAFDEPSYEGDTDPHPPATPEPLTVVGLLMGCGALAGACRRRVRPSGAN